MVQSVTSDYIRNVERLGEKIPDGWLNKIYKSRKTYNSSRRHFLISCRPWQAIVDLFGRFLSLWPKVSFEFSSLYPFLKSHLVFLKKFLFFFASHVDKVFFNDVKSLII